MGAPASLAKVSFSISSEGTCCAQCWNTGWHFKRPPSQLANGALQLFASTEQTLGPSPKCRLIARAAAGEYEHKGQRQWREKRMMCGAYALFMRLDWLWDRLVFLSVIVQNPLPFLHFNTQTLFSLPGYVFSGIIFAENFVLSAFEDNYSNAERESDSLAWYQVKKSWKNYYNVLWTFSNQVCDADLYIKSPSNSQIFHCSP